MSERKHPKIHFDDKGNTLFLNFGEYGQWVDVACFSGDGTRLLTVKEVGVASIWDMASGQLLKEIRPTSPLSGRKDVSPTAADFKVFVESAALNQDGSLALLGLNDGTAGIFSTQDAARLSTFYPPDTLPAEKWGLIRAVNFSPDGSLALVGFSHRSIGVWSVQDHTLVRFLINPHSDRLFRRSGFRDTLVTNVLASQDNRSVFAGFADMTATVWSLDSQEVLFDAFQYAEETVGLWAEGERVIFATTGGSVWEADPQQGVVQRFTTEENWREVVFAPEGQTFLARTVDGSIHRWWLDGRSENIDRILEYDSVFSTVFRQGGDLVAYITDPDHLTVVAPEKITHLELDSEEFHFHRFSQVYLSPRGDMLAIPGSRCVKIWGFPGGELLHVLRQEFFVHGVSFSRDGRLLALTPETSGGGGMPAPISIWDIQTGSLWCELPGDITPFIFGLEKNQLINASPDGTIRAWTLDHKGLSNPSVIARRGNKAKSINKLQVLSDGRILLFVHRGLEVWFKGRQIEISVPYGEDNQWLSRDEAYLCMSFGGKDVRRWSLHSGKEVEAFRSGIKRPEWLPGPALYHLRNIFEPTAGCYLHRTPEGVFTHVGGDGPRGWYSPVLLSRDGKFVLLPGSANAALVDISESQRLISLMPFEGQLRAACILENQVLIVNSKGRLFVYDRTD